MKVIEVDKGLLKERKGRGMKRGREGKQGVEGIE